ncbi:uncharacterized protein G2W53_039644 [Senna tora]|uniref:Transmembrane protein n=1 Tax=Senna tora TaxID=362788 RepID=A0A834W3S0_9FABA|nr:uncharacterized protein G2W53_039644 [Senna tora]
MECNSSTVRPFEPRRQSVRPFEPRRQSVRPPSSLALFAMLQAASVLGLHRAAGLSSRRDLAVRLLSVCGSYFVQFVVVRTVWSCYLLNPSASASSDPLPHRPSFSRSVRHSPGYSVVNPSVRRTAARSVGFCRRASLFYLLVFVTDQLGFSSFRSTCPNRRLVPCRQSVRHLVRRSSAGSTTLQKSFVVLLSSFFGALGSLFDRFDFAAACSGFFAALSAFLSLVVVFHCSFSRSVTRSVGYRRPSAVLSAVPSLDPLVSVSRPLPPTQPPSSADFFSSERLSSRFFFTQTNGGGWRATRIAGGRCTITARRSSDRSVADDLKPRRVEA